MEKYYYESAPYCYRAGNQRAGKPVKKNQWSEKNLWKFVKDNSKPAYQTVYDDQDNEIENIANKGLVVGESAIRAGKEYNGLTLKALEDIKPILTDHRVSRAIKYEAAGNIQKAIAVLRIIDEVYEHGIGLLYGILKLWLEINDISVPGPYINKAIKIKSNKIINWIESDTWSPIIGRFEIVDIGWIEGRGTSVVPESWMGRIFDDALSLHRAMDALESRKGKAPVSFCAIYAMHIKKIKRWENIDDVKLARARIGIAMFPDRRDLNSEITIFATHKIYLKWLAGLPKKSNVLNLHLNTDNAQDRLIIACQLDRIVMDPVYEKKRNVGLLVSTMQKLLRRGPGCAQELKNVLEELWKSPQYNLPEQQFLRVNASRQLVWRLFITSIEDIAAYSIKKNTDYLSMSDLACLAVLANGYPDIRFNEWIFDKILMTGLAVQSIDRKWDMLKNMDHFKEPVPLKETGDQMLNALTMLFHYMPARQWDKFLITGSFNYIKQGKEKLPVLKKTTLSKLLSHGDEKEAIDGLLAGMDMHAYPNLLIIFQASLPELPSDTSKHTTRSLWSFIWDYSSGINFRLKQPDMDAQEIEMLNILKNIQRTLTGVPVAKGTIIDPEYDKINDSRYDKFMAKNQYIEVKKNVQELTKRIGFILLFGERKAFSYKNKKYDIVIAGNDQEIIKVKNTWKKNSEYLSGPLRREIEMEFLKDFNHNMLCPDAPVGYHWVWGDKKTITLRSSVQRNKIKFYVDDQELAPFDASPVLVNVNKISPRPMVPDIRDIIKQALYVDDRIITNDPDDQGTVYDQYDINLLMRKLHEKQLPVYDWVNIAKQATIPSKVWRSIYIKLHSNTNNSIVIGPVDGHGNALQNSISYLYEGTLWRIFNLLSMLYGLAIRTTRAVKSLKFDINRNTPEYLDLIEKLNILSFSENANQYQDSETKNIKIITKLWEHQKSTVYKILDDIFKLGRRGFGDASTVGSGKSLSGLAIMANLYNHNIKIKSKSHGAFLVLLPTTHLYDTWITEINKHCQGFHVVTQNANGTLSSGDVQVNTLQRNSILISTLGRTRDHALSESWIFVVIDECLSVQNKNALQTEEAWRQIIASQYGVLLASATFFRARFDKLFYMLKMLNTGLPENKNYLDAILSESIVSHVSSKTRDWVVKNNSFDLPDDLRTEYNLILGKDLASDKMYIKLQTFLYDNFNYMEAFKKVIRKCEARGSRCLIYAKSKNEADAISDYIRNVSRFPDTTGKHLVISYTEGTYGLNTLIYLDTIVSRFPEPDKLPQMKGRLDRPNQKNDKLYIEYIYIENTIDQAGMFRLEMANNFYNNYIMPLAEFYDIAVGRKKAIM
jgi:hypothetical protein